jgi:dihydroorotase
VVNAAQAHAYRQEILSALPKDSEFNPLMVLYLTDNTTPKDIQEALDIDANHLV